MQTGQWSTLFTDLSQPITVQVQGGWWAYHQPSHPAYALSPSPCDSSRDTAGATVVPGYHYGYYGQ